MTVLKALEWVPATREPGKEWAWTEFEYMPTYTVHPTPEGGWYAEGASDGTTRTVEDAKRVCQDHYDRRRRLKAWEDYMVAHDPPEGL